MVPLHSVHHKKERLCRCNKTLGSMWFWQRPQGSRVKVITEKIEFIGYCHRLSFFQQEQHLFKELGDISNKRQPLDVVKNPEKTTAHIECGLWRGFAFNQMLLQWKKSFCFVLLRTTCSLYWDDPKNNPSWQFTSERNGTWLVRHLSRCWNIWSAQNINLS